MDYKEALSKVQSSGTANKENTLKECESKLKKTRNIWNIIVIIAFALAVAARFALSIYTGLIGSPLRPHERAIHNTLMAVFIAFAATGVVLLIVGTCIVGALKKKKSAAEYSLNFDAEITGKINGECSRLYEMCVSNGITAINADNMSDLMLVAKQLGVTDPVQAKWRFERGEALSVISAAQKENEEKAQLIAQADEYLKQNQEQSALVGKEKYKAYSKKQALIFKALADEQKSIATATSALADVARSNKPRDWGTAGGLASAALGPAAGVAVAASIQQQNQQDAQHAANTLERSGNIIADANKKYVGYMNSYEAWNRKITQIDGLIADEDEKYFGSVKITVNAAEVTPAGTMSIRLSTEITDDSPALLGKPALIDGSFTLYVCEDGRRIGSTIVCAPDFNSIDCKKMGYDGAKLSALCRASQGNSFSAEKQYSFEFENIHTWAIQKW